jgi:hypothetical protein
VLITQAFEAMYNEEDILNSDIDEASNAFNDLVNDTIHEALVYQILIKSCAFLDEWNKVFGVTTEPKDKGRILEVKKIAKPAYKCIGKWKQLREFRNHFIAHNHRNGSGLNVYLHPTVYNSPQSNSELFLLAACIKRMTDVIFFFFREEVEKFIENRHSVYPLKNHKFMSKAQIRKTLAQIDQEIQLAIKSQAN